jgi:hypothetical protein
MTTNQVSLNQIIVDAQTNFKNLLEKTLTLMEKYSTTYGIDDGRTVFFANFLQLNLWLLIQFDNFRNVVFTPTSTSVSEYISLRTEENAKQFKLQYDRINRASYCTVAIFDVENFLRDIVKQLGTNTDDVTYRGLIGKLQRQLNLTVDQTRILRAPSDVRNSLHNNGFHTENNFEVVIRGKTYKFVKNDKVSFTGWENLYIMFDALVDIIEFILQSAYVRNLPNIPHTSET